MKTAFTLLELIFIIVIIGIVGITASSSFRKDTLVPATMQVLDHIRYTQQLALNQDIFTPAPAFSLYSDVDRKRKDSKQWFKKWWQMQIHEADDDYTIYSDAPTSASTTNNYDALATSGVDLIATDPQTRELIAGKSTHVPSNYLKIANLQDEYQTSISFSGCGTKRRIAFDNLGRPHCTKSIDDSSDYPYSEILKAPAKITLTTSNGESSAICITPITGYAYISTTGSCP